MSESGFDPGLSQASHAGTFFVTSDDLDGLGMAARDAGLNVHRIDLLGCHNKATLLLRIGSALEFPPGSGRNWDALSDRLDDLAWLPASGHVLLFDEAGGYRAADETGFDTLVEILDDISQRWASRDVPFWSFLALPEDDPAGI